jgi:Zn-dependent protease/predicted transcriptional regulator
MKYSFKIGSVWGIPIELHITFILLMIGVFILTYPNFYSFTLVLFLFIFVTLHEISHSWVARRFNIKVRKIVLYPIAGVSEIDEIPDNPRIEWRVAIAGPLSSFVIGAILLLLNQVVPLQTPPIPGLIVTGSLLFTLGILNVILGAFNLIPAFPMDGGRIFRAVLAEHMKFTDATKYAAYIGRIFGIVFAIIGFVFNAWFIIVGLFVYIGANEEAEATILSTTMARVRIRDVMNPEKRSATPTTSLSDAVELMLTSRYHDILVESDGKFLGIIEWADIMKIKPENRNSVQIQDLPLKKFFIYDDESVLEANKLMAREKIDLLPVVEKFDEYKIVGVITNESMSTAIERAKALR